MNRKDHSKVTDHRDDSKKDLPTKRKRIKSLDSDDEAENEMKSKMLKMKNWKIPKKEKKPVEASQALKSIHDSHSEENSGSETETEKKTTKPIPAAYTEDLAPEVVDKKSEKRKNRNSNSKRPPSPKPSACDQKPSRTKILNSLQVDIFVST